jgi:hypothetical protein
LSDDPAIAPIVAALRAYLASRPHAIDSARGIRERWLEGLPGLQDPATIDTALERLAAEGLVERMELPDGGTLWRAITARK